MLERTLRKDRGIARRHQQHVALAHRDIELLREVQQHVAARLRAASFDKAQMPGGNAGVAGEVELAQAAALPPLSYAARRPGARGAIEHAASLARPLQCSNYPAGNGRAMRPRVRRSWFGPADGDKRIRRLCSTLPSTAWSDGDGRLRRAGVPDAGVGDARLAARARRHVGGRPARARARDRRRHRPAARRLHRARASRRAPGRSRHSSFCA